MSFPEFDSGGTKLLVFTRGRGRGHAIADIEIVDRLQRSRDDVQVRFVSYATGGAVFAEFEVPYIDLGMPIANPITDTTVLAGKLIAWLRPDVVLSHEEFPALPVAKVFGTPTLAVTDWFNPTESYSSHSLKYADRILFAGERGAFEEPDWVRDKTRYVGYLVRPLEPRPAIREESRRRLGLDPDAFVVGVVPGDTPESVTPAADLVADAFHLAPIENKQLVWLAGPDFETLSSRFADDPRVLLLRDESALEPLTGAMDIAITKGGRNTTLLELGLLGVPAVVLSNGENSANDRKAQHLPHVAFRMLEQADAAWLAGRLGEAVGAVRRPVPLPLGLDVCAEEISAFLTSAAPRPSAAPPVHGERS